MTNVYERSADLDCAITLAEELREALNGEPELEHVCMHLIACLEAKAEIADEKRRRQFAADAARDALIFEADRAAAKAMRHKTQ